MYSRVSRSIPFIQKRLYTRVVDTPHLVEDPAVLVIKNKGACTILLNRPKQLNAFNMNMIDAFFPYLEECEHSDQVNMVFLKGQGRAFSSGADLKAVVEILKNPSRRNELESFADKVYNSFYYISTMKTPIITFMDGISVGAGYSYSSLSRFNVATENTKVALPEARFGHFCDASSCFYLPRLNGNLGKYMAMSGNTLAAEDILLAGLATHFVPSRRLEYVEDALVNLDRHSDDIISKTINQFSIRIDDIPSSNIVHGKNRDTIERCFQFDAVTKIFQALEKEGSKFALDTIDQMLLASPISLSLTLESQIRGAKLSLAQALRMERYFWKISPFLPDFYEGVSATIVEKRKPQWSCKSYLDVDFKKEITERYFGIKKEKLNLYFEPKYDDLEEWFYNPPSTSIAE